MTRIEAHRLETVNLGRSTYSFFGGFFGQPDLLSFFEDRGSPGVLGQHLSEPLELGLFLLSKHVLSHLCFLLHCVIL